MSWLALDIETSGLTWDCRILGVSYAHRPDPASPITTGYLNIGMRDLFESPMTTPEARNRLRVLLDGAEFVCMHGASFDLPFLLRDGLLTAADVRNRLWDTTVMARSTGPHDSVALDDLVEELHLAKDAPWSGMKRMRSRLERLTVQEVSEYAQKDASYTLQIAEQQYALAQTQYAPEFLRTDGNFTSLISQMRVLGIPLDVEWIQAAAADRRVLVAGIIIKELAQHGIRGPNDRTGLLAWLHARGVQSPKLTAKGAESLDEEALLGVRPQLHDPDDIALLDTILAARAASKEESTWLMDMLHQADDAGRVHPQFGVGGAVSFRLTCSNPNVQAIPHDMPIFAPSAGFQCLLSLDYSQAELRLAAMIARENALARIFNTPGTDVHLATAALMFGEANAKAHRSEAKRANFGAIYGAGTAAIAAAIGCTEEKAAELIASHKKAFPKLYTVSKEVERTWKSRTYLRLSSGRRLYGTHDDLTRRPYKAFNQLIQGSVAETVRAAMLCMAEEANAGGYRLVSQVHDSIVLEVADGIALAPLTARLQAIMADVMPEHIAALTDPRIIMAADASITTRKPKERESWKTD